MSSPTPPASFIALTPRLNSLVGHATALIEQMAPAVIRSLERWEQALVRVQPCLRDLRGEHVLFDKTDVVGIVDYGAMAEDHPAVDLARLLGDFAWQNDRHFSAGLQSYRAAGGQLDAPDNFVQQLAHSGDLGSAIIWLRRLSYRGKTELLSARVEARFALLVERIKLFAPV
jgi:homoserine kinase type II